MLQAFIVLPGFALVYLVTAPAGLRRRLRQLALAGLAVLVSAGWWPAIVAAIPSGSRPYIGGSQNDSVLELALGYNGLGRLNGDEAGGLGNTNQQADRHGGRSGQSDTSRRARGERRGLVGTGRPARERSAWASRPLPKPDGSH